MTQPIYAIGDIHGQLSMLENALELISKDGGNGAPLVFLGDYTDRGPDSKGVIDFLIREGKKNPNWIFIKGNHDAMFSGFLNEAPYFDPHLFVGLYWLHPRLGGDTTLASYGVDVHEKRRLGEVHSDARDAVPQDHIDFLNDGVITFETDDLFFVHAGVRPGIPFADQAERDLVWIREGFVDHTDPYEKLVVHGHTALDAPEHFGNRIDLDGGAGYGRPLIPAVFEGTDCFLLTKDGRVPLR